ncbi:MAG TPA: hypothetical protein VEJ63_07990 [Planctomycetota bacterium]|nr:hypothetical protein [Planctomycetota bacterium]
MVRLTAVVLFISLFLSVGARAESKKEFEARKKEAFAKEAKGDWKKLDWQPDMKTAMKVAQEKQKPILVTIIVNERGKKDAEHC